MVTQEEIVANRDKLYVIRDLIDTLIQHHDSATHSWIIDGEERFLSDEQIAELIAEYLKVKPQLITQYQELL